jgi:hypothetical protein
VVTICAAQWSLYVPPVVTICTAQWSLYVPPVVTICTASSTSSNSTFCPHSVFTCSVWISEQTAIIPLYNINWLVCITETRCVYCAVRTGSLSLCILQADLKSFKSSSLHSFAIHLVLNVEVSHWLLVDIYRFFSVDLVACLLFLVLTSETSSVYGSRLCAGTPILRRWHKISTLSFRPLTLYTESMQAVLYCSRRTWNYQTRNRVKNWSVALLNTANTASPNATRHCVSVGRATVVLYSSDWCVGYQLWMINCCVIYY